MGNRCLYLVFGIMLASLTGCHHCCPWYSPYYGYGYGTCVDPYCGDCGSVYDFDLPGGRRWGHGCRSGRMMRQPCPCCGQPMPGGFGGCFDAGFGCSTGFGCGCQTCGTGFECGCNTCGDTYCGNGMPCSSCPGGQMAGDAWQTSTQHWDVNTGWSDRQPGQTRSSQPSVQSQPMAPSTSDEYYVPSEPSQYGSEPQPTEASGAQFLMPQQGNLMPQQGNAVQPILWAPPGR